MMRNTINSLILRMLTQITGPIYLCPLPYLSAKYVT